MADLPAFDQSARAANSKRAVVRGKIYKIDTIEIDVVRDETHTLSNTVTDNPVEEGALISDHSRPDPDQVTLSCYVSNTPRSQDQMKRAASQGASDNTLLRPDGSLQIQQVADRGTRVFAALKKLRDEGTLISVATSLRVYGVSSTEGMLITNLTFPRNSKNFDGLEWSIQLKQVRIVRNRATQQALNKDKRANKKDSKGNKTPEEDEFSTLSNLNSASSGRVLNGLVGLAGASGSL